MLFNLQPSEFLCYLTVGDIPEGGFSFLVFGLVNISSPFVGWVNEYFDFLRILGFLLNFAHLGTSFLLFQVSFDAISIVWSLNPIFQLMRNPVHVRDVAIMWFKYLWCLKVHVCSSFYAPIQSAPICDKRPISEACFRLQLSAKFFALLSLIIS